MPEFLTTLATSARIETIISKAAKHVVIVSPYLRWSALLYERLQATDRRGVPIIFVYGKSELRRDQRELLAQVKNLSLYYYANLHAKCYFNEQELIISSLNLHEFSERNNREMSVAFNVRDRVYEDAVVEVQSIIDASQLEQGSRREVLDAKRAVTQDRDRASSQRRDTHRRSSNARQVDRDNEGFCIRCCERIDHDREKPHCPKCDRSWSAFGNYDYEEQYCHGCGVEYATSRARPVCLDCYRGMT